ncbi:MAG: discoidin domain-containing protein, partial [Chloroflexota bacterium]|nr:discoidin domain-containing protein [Chloroflexota bacterium]
PNNLIDESPTNGWSTAQGQKTNQYVIVALPQGQTYSIAKVRINPFTASGNTDAYKVDSIKNFQIRVSTTDVNVNSFRTVFSGQTPMEKAFFDFTFTAAQAKYVMLFVVDNWGGDFVEATEFEVYQSCDTAGGGGGTNPPPPTQVPGGGQCDGIPASQNSTVTPSNCAKAGTSFVFEATGFKPGESVTVYAKDPNGQVIGSNSQVVADANGALLGPNSITLHTTTATPTGVYALFMEGVTSHNKAVGYIKLLAP